MEFKIEECLMVNSRRRGRPGVGGTAVHLTPHVLLLVFSLLLVLLPLQLFAAPISKLTELPLGERWYSIKLGDERVGFNRLNITRTDTGYRIDSEGSVKMRVMGFSREATSKESYLVSRDLVLQSFSAENRIDGSPVTVTGEVTPKGVDIISRSGSGTKERTLKLKGALYPPHALNLYPLMQGTSKGKSYKLSVLDVEAQKVKKLKVEVVGEETLPPGRSVVHLKNDVYPMVDNDIWVDLQGNVLKESVRDDLVVTEAEDEATARAELARNALCKTDLVLDFSMIRITPPIERPAKLQKLVLELTGLPANLPLLQGKRQQMVRQADGSVLVTLPNPAPGAEAPPTAAEREAAERIPSDHPEIKAKAAEITGSEQDPARVAKLLSDWVAHEIKGTVTDSQSPVETLKGRNGNCQSHARLYASLARAAGIPTRFVSGIVYQGNGFLYHSWAESYLGGAWVPIDPTFGEMPANLSHIKFVEGETLDEMGALAGMIGKVRAKVIEKKY